jgi:formate-nitrite transporter family protein
MVNRRQIRLNEEAAQEVARLRAPVVYTAIKREGEDELARPALSLWWSGVSAGLGIFFSVVAMGTLHHFFVEKGMNHPLVHLGYTLGFLIVIIGRLQLFTENTITAVIPLLSSLSWRTLMRTLRLWGIVFAANITGVAIAAAATIHGHIFADDITQGILTVSAHYIHRDALTFFLQAIPAGFIIAALVWMLPSSHGKEFWVITTMTYILSAAGMTHVIAGAGEVFVMIMAGQLSFIGGMLGSILPTLAGNVIGGTLLFSMLVYGQVHREI